MAVGVRLIKDTEKIKLMRECIDEANLQAFVPDRGDRYYFTKNFIQHVEELKSKRLTKEQYLDFINTNPTLMPKYLALKAEIAEREAVGNMKNVTRYKDLEKAQKDYSISNIQHTLEGYKVKIVSDIYDGKYGDLEEAANLEDVYLYYF